MGPTFPRPPFPPLLNESSSVQTKGEVWSVRHTEEAAFSLEAAAWFTGFIIYWQTASVAGHISPWLLSEADSLFPKKILRNVFEFCDQL